MLLYVGFITLAISSICSISALPVNTALELYAAPSQSESQGSNNKVESKSNGKRAHSGAFSRNNNNVDLDLHLGQGPSRKMKKVSQDGELEAKHFGPSQMLPPRIDRRPEYMDTADSRIDRLDKKAKLHDVWMPGYKYNPETRGEDQDKKQHRLFHYRKSRVIKNVGDLVEKHLGTTFTPEDKRNVRDQALSMGKNAGFFYDTQNEFYNATKHWSGQDLVNHDFKLNRYDRHWTDMIKTITATRPSPEIKLQDKIISVSPQGTSHSQLINEGNPRLS
jgi:hypothetical protein